MFKTLRVSNINSNYYDNTDERYTTSNDLTLAAADAFWPDAEAPWRPYVLVAIQDKDLDGRNARYDAWSGEERFLRSVADVLRAQRFRWSKL